MQAEAGDVGTENLRLAMLQYRALFGDLLGQPSGPPARGARASLADVGLTAPQAPTGSPRRGGSPPGDRLAAGLILAAHVQPDDRARHLAAPDLHQVTHLVDHPQAMPGVLR